MPFALQLSNFLVGPSIELAMAFTPNLNTSHFIRNTSMSPAPSRVRMMSEQGGTSLDIPNSNPPRLHRNQGHASGAVDNIEDRFELFLLSAGDKKVTEEVDTRKSLRAIGLLPQKPTPQYHVFMRCQVWLLIGLASRHPFSIEILL